jgi:hypothetical protein
MGALFPVWKRITEILIASERFEMDVMWPACLSAEVPTNKYQQLALLFRAADKTVFVLRPVGKFFSLVANCRAVNLLFCTAHETSPHNDHSGGFSYSNGPRTIIQIHSILVRWGSLLCGYFGFSSVRLNKSSIANCQGI